MPSDRPTAKPPFSDSVRPQEKSIPAEIGYSRIVIGQAYLVDTSVPEISDTPSNLTDEAREEVLSHLEQAAHAIEARYKEKLKQVGNLPIETRDYAEGMIEAEMLILEENYIKPHPRTGEPKKGGRYVNIEEQLVAGLSVQQAVYDVYQERINTLRARAEILTEQMEQSKKEGLMEQANNLQRAASDSRRYSDLFQIIQVALLKELRGEDEMNLANAPDGSIPVTEYLPVGEVVHFRNADGYGVRMHGMINWKGVDQDHTNIIAKSSRISVARASQNDVKQIQHGSTIIIDGPGRRIILNPSDTTLATFTRQLRQQIDLDQELTALSHEVKWRRTRDSKTIKVSANIGYVDEMAAVKYANAPAVGLFRTEIPVLTRGTNISREKWIEIFQEIGAESIDSQARTKSVTIRTVDFEGDKVQEALKHITDPVQRAETIEEMIRNQMAAALLVLKDFEGTQAETDTVAFCPVPKFHMMIPMIKDVEHFEHMQGLMNDVAEELELSPLKLGMMVETISAIENLDKINAAFLSIGSNDLIPALLGYGRFDPDRAREYDPTHPTVLKYLARILEHETDHKPVSICGDIATDPRYFALLAGLGFKHISAGVGAVPLQKELVRRINTEAATALVEKIEDTSSRAEREALLEEFNERYLGLKPDGTFIPKEKFEPPELHESYVI